MKSCLLKTCLDHYPKEVEHYSINGHTVGIKWEYGHYGYILRQWAIDGENTVVRETKNGMKEVLFDCSNSLCYGPFEKDCIVYELFCIPLGLEPIYYEEFNSVGCRLHHGVKHNDLQKYRVYS